MTDWLNRTHLGDCRDLMRRMAADGVRVQCIVTSPPYWGLRDYGVTGQFGLERTWVRHVARMRGVFRLAHNLLADDGTLWLNYGDSYVSNVGGAQGKRGQRYGRRFTAQCTESRRGNGLKPKDLIGMPWRVAFALQADGWFLRSEIIWHKPNPMPESVTDRPTKTHEQIFLLAKSGQYYFDAEAIKELASANSHARASRGRIAGYEPPGQIAHSGICSPRPGVNPKCAGWADGPGSHSPKDHARARDGLKDSTKFGRGAGWRVKQNESFSAEVMQTVEKRMARTVWTIPTQPFPGSHFATFPEDLVARCILAGTKPDDVVLDPFIGSGTVAKVATDLGRRFIGCELNPAYIDMHDLRRTTMGMKI